MLISFTVKNYGSIYSPVTLDMSACQDEEMKDSLFKYQDDSFIPVLGIFGPNASGKSTVLRAFDFVCQFVTGRLSIRNKGDKIPYKPFKFNSQAGSEPSDFIITFTTNNILYEYELACTDQCVVHEHLFSWPTSRKSEIFSRNFQAFHFTKRNEKLQQPLAARTNENRPYLFTSNEWNLTQTEEAYLWFRKMPRFDLSGNGWPRVFESILEDKKRKTSLVKMVKKADLGIEDIISKEIVANKKTSLRVKDFPKTFLEAIGIDDSEIPEDLKVELGSDHKISTVHSVNGITALIDMADESKGTQKYLSIIGPAIDSFEKGYLVCMDEFETSLHPLLAKRIIEMFMDPEINKAHAQLIFISHDVSLLDLTLLRRDQISFVEKSLETGETEIYKLRNINKVRKDENVLKGYLQGRYGAIPFITE